MKITFIGITLTFCCAASAFAECTRDQAFNRMMQLNTKSMNFQAEVSKLLTTDPEKFNAEQARFKDFAVKLGSGGKLLADGRYNEACALYSALDREFNLPADRKQTLTMERLRKNGGKSTATGCDLSQAAIKMAALSSAFAHAFDEGKITSAQSTQFTRDTESIGVVMNQEPSKACLMIVETAAKFELSLE